MFSYLMRKIIAYVLISLVATSFVVDNNLFYEGELCELLEKLEKESDKKKKKLLLFGLDLPSVIYDLEKNANKKWDENISLSIVSLDVSTHPPELM